VRQEWEERTAGEWPRVYVEEGLEVESVIIAALISGIDCEDYGMWVNKDLEGNWTLILLKVFRQASE